MKVGDTSWPKGTTEPAQRAEKTRPRGRLHPSAGESAGAAGAVSAPAGRNVLCRPGTVSFAPALPASTFAAQLLGQVMAGGGLDFSTAREAYGRAEASAYASVGVFSVRA
jgi:hypothetical protein